MAKGKAKGKGQGNRSASSSSRKPVDQAALLDKISHQVAGWAMKMVTSTTSDEVVKVGNLQALPCLFEAIGLYPAPAVTEEKAESDDLAATRLKQLGL